MICPGCALDLAPQAGLPDPIFHSSAECWALYGELAARTQLLRDPAFPHQHAVDAYTAQHVGEAMPPVAAVFALLGLCLALEHGSSGRQVQLAHMKLGRTRRPWPRLLPAQHRFDVRIDDVVAGRAGLRAFMDAAWRAWPHAHAEVRALVTKEALCRR